MPVWLTPKGRAVILSALVLVAACEQPPNFTAMSTRELVVLSDTHEEDDTGRGARLELARRPRDAPAG